jgi:hypothetical protein
MIAEVDSAIETFPERFRAMVADGLEGVPDRNLETGGPAGAGLGHPASDEAARKLEALRELQGATAWLQNPKNRIEGRPAGPSAVPEEGGGPTPGSGGIFRPVVGGGTLTERFQSHRGGE